MAEPTRLDAAIGSAADALEVAHTRLPVERTGPRTPIDPFVRTLVLRRDRFRCDWCGADGRGQPFHLDHIVPWSAGGSDDTTNLRLLCPYCNEERSNYRTDADYARRLPCTPMCLPCSNREVSRTDFRPDEIESVFCATCNRTSWIAKASYWGCVKF